MKLNKWTLGLASVGLVSLASVATAEEKASPVMTALSSTTISGYVDASAVWRPGNNTSIGRATSPNWTGAAGDNRTPGLLGGNKSDGFNLNAVKLSIERALPEEEWAAAYKVDMLFGPDAVGWNPSANGDATTDMAIKQAYVLLRAPVGNGLDFKVGVFDTPIGYEVFDNCSNPHYSHSYGFSLEPTQHTGVLASYKVNDLLTASLGVANTTASMINARATRNGVAADESEKTYMGLMEFTAPESLGFLKDSKLYLGFVNGLGSGAASAKKDTTWLYAGATLKTPVEGLTVGGAFDYRATGSDNTANNYTARTEAYTAGAYLGFQATEKLKLNVRGEYAKGTAGTWYTVGAVENDPKNQLMALTGTIDYSLWANVITRAEVRFDRDLTGQRASASSPGPFGWDDANNLYVALNIIYKF